MNPTKKMLAEAEEREMFLLLFYRERVARLAQRLESQEGSKRALRKRHKKNTLADLDLNMDQVAKFLLEFIRRAENPDICNDICKSMYFCDRKKGHKGRHGEWCGEWPPPKLVGSSNKLGAGWLGWT